MDEVPSPLPGRRRLISGALVLMAARVLTMGLGLLQAVLLATKFGVSTGTDAYFVAYSACLLFIGPIEMVLNTAFVPTFVHEAEESGEVKAWRTAATLYRIGLVGAAGVVGILLLASPWLGRLLAPGLEAAGAGQVGQMIRILAPMIVVVYVASFLSTMEFIAGRTLLPALGMVAHSLAGPLALWFLSDRFGIAALAWGLLLGALVRLGLQTLRLRTVRHLLGPGVPLGDPRLRQIGRTVFARVLTSWFMQLNLMVDRVFASFLGPGYISSLAYAHRAVMTIVRLFMMPVGRVLIPQLSRRAARGETDRIGALLQRLVVGLACLVLPLVAFLVVFRMEILEFLFQRGSFDRTAVETTAEALLFYSLGIVPFMLIPLLNGTFFSLKNTKTPLKVGAVAVVANVALDAILIGSLGQGGIALATSLVAAIRAALLWQLIQRQIGPLRSRPVFISLLVSTTSAAAAFGGAYFLGPLAGVSAAQPMWQLALFGVAGSLGYLVLQAVFNRPVVDFMRRVVLRRLQARAS